jgi:phage shock protein A
MTKTATLTSLPHDIGCRNCRSLAAEVAELKQRLAASVTAASVVESYAKSEIERLTDRCELLETELAVVRDLRAAAEATVETGG